MRIFALIELSKVTALRQLEDTADGASPDGAGQSY
jgi:hypothetical protein